MNGLYLKTFQQVSVKILRTFLKHQNAMKLHHILFIDAESIAEK